MTEETAVAERAAAAKVPGAPGRQRAQFFGRLAMLWSPRAERLPSEFRRFIRRCSRRTAFENLWVAKVSVQKGFQIARAELRHILAAAGWKIAREGRYRTAYVIGLYGGGRTYLNELISAHLGKRGKYLIQRLRCHPAPTSLIYSYHATIKYARLFEEPPEVTTRVLQSVGSGFADLIFIYRHPLDSLLSNWIFLRTLLQKPSRGYGFVISQNYGRIEDLSSVLEQNFAEFKAFAAGDASFTAAVPGPPFLSFAEFVEETALFIDCATLSLRLEDFMSDPVREFARMAQVMSVDLDMNGLSVPRPQTQLYRYRAVAERVPQFRAFIEELDGETRGRIERMGYLIELRAPVA
jgi:hypothetical protein